MKRLPWIIGLLMLAERVWKHWMVVRFFRRPLPASAADPTLVSIIQPILSGDPTLPAFLERNLQLKTRYPLEYIWLVDTDDSVGQQICKELITRHPERKIQLIILPPPAELQNPKTIKLIAGMQEIHGDVVIVLDDDTQLPDNGLEQCLPFLDQPGVGLAFGLAYYVNFSNVWSSMVSAFANSNSLLLYVPYTSLIEPFTINGMFYAMRREVLEKVGGFEGLEHILADDFAVAQRFREHGYRLAQTPLCHGISTQVKGLRHYINLTQRWFALPRESVLRHLSWYERSLIVTLGLVPALFPLVLVTSLLLRPSRRTLAYTLLYFGYSFASFADLDRRYLRGATPSRKAWWVPIMQVIFPLQLLVAFLLPLRVNWRGTIIQVERGGNLRIVRRRNEA